MLSVWFTMKPLLEPDIPLRPRMRPLWMTWGPIALLLLIAAGAAFGFWVAKGPDVPRKVLIH
jgi:hypothetical protein